MITTPYAIRALQEHRTRAHLIPADLDRPRPSTQIQCARRMPVGLLRELTTGHLWYGMILIVALVTACGGTVASTTTAASEAEATTTVPITTAAPTTTKTAEPATTTSAAPDAAPPELSGRWQTEKPFGRVILSLVGTNYSFNVVGQGFNGEGKISVSGNQIRFYDAFPNPGEGFYEWTLDGDTLTFIALEPLDVTGGRRAALVDFIWTRL